MWKWLISPLLFAVRVRRCVTGDKKCKSKTDTKILKKTHEQKSGSEKRQKNKNIPGVCQADIKIRSTVEYRIFGALASTALKRERGLHLFRVWFSFLEFARRDSWNFLVFWAIKISNCTWHHVPNASECLCLCKSAKKIEIQRRRVYYIFKIYGVGRARRNRIQNCVS